MGEAEISSEFEYSASFLRILIPGVIAVTLASILVILNYSSYISIFKESISESVWVVLPIGIIFVLISMLVGLIINVFNTRLTMILEGYPLKILGCSLEQSRKKYLFCWNEVPGKDEQKLRKFLKDIFGIEWVEKAKISKHDDNRTISVFGDENSVEITIDEKRKKAALKLAENQIYQLLIKEENNKLNVYQKKFGILKKWQWEKYYKCRTAYKSAEPESIERGSAYTNLLNYYSHCLYKKTINPDIKDDDLKELIMPTELGNVFKSIETYPKMKYGMDGVFFWSRIQFVVSPENKPALDKMRAYVDMFVELTWIFIFAAVIYLITLAYTGKYLYSFSSLVIFTLFTLGSYNMAVQSALDFGSYVRSTFDLYRGDLWAKLKYGQFDNGKLESLPEKERWNDIFKYLWFHNSEMCQKCGRFYEKTEEHKCG